MKTLKRMIFLANVENFDLKRSNPEAMKNIGVEVNMRGLIKKDSSTYWNCNIRMYCKREV